MKIENLYFHVGYLDYKSHKASFLKDTLVAVVMGVGGVMLVVVVIILIIFKRRSSAAQRQFKKLNMQLDVLESNIRNECKQGSCLRFVCSRVSFECSRVSFVCSRVSFVCSCMSFECSRVSFECSRVSFVCFLV